MQPQSRYTKCFAIAQNRFQHCCRSLPRQLAAWQRPSAMLGWQFRFTSLLEIKSQRTPHAKWLESGGPWAKVPKVFAPGSNLRPYSLTFYGAPRQTKGLKDLKVWVKCPKAGCEGPKDDSTNVLLLIHINLDCLKKLSGHEVQVIMDGRAVGKCTFARDPEGLQLVEEVGILACFLPSTSKELFFIWFGNASRILSARLCWNLLWF